MALVAGGAAHLVVIAFLFGLWYGWIWRRRYGARW